MLRRFNYTGRKKIPRSAVSVSLLDGQLPPAFDAKLDLSGLDLPGTARVYVEAYYRASYMRFSYGQVSDLCPPRDRVLHDIEGGGTPQFRIKVVDETAEHGRVLAEADSIDPLLANEENSDRIPLLPVKFEDLEDEVWRLDLESDDGRPALVLNKRIECISLASVTNDAFFALVYPEVVRQVLRNILLVLRLVDRDGPFERWEVQWLHFANALPGVVWPGFRNDGAADLTDEEKNRRESWIEHVVRAFARMHRVSERFTRAQGGGGAE